MATRIATAIGALALAVAASAAALAGGTPTQKCQAVKLKAAGKEIAGKIGCHSKAKAKAQPVDPSCLAKAQAKADAAINKAGSVACAGVAAAIDAEVDSCVGALVGDDPGTGKCPAASAKAIGKAGGALLACESREVTKPGTLAACDTKNDGKLGGGLTRAGGCVAFGLVHPHVHACDDVRAAVIPPTTTSTSTSASTTSSTSPAPVCGNGVVEPGEECDGSAAPCTPGLYAGCQAPGAPSECQCCIGEGATCGFGATVCCGTAQCYFLGPSIGVCSATCVGSGGSCGGGLPPCCGGPCVPTGPGTGVCP